MDKQFEKPEVTDYGTLTELTAALGISGAEDGASKISPLHHVTLSLPIP